MLGNTFSNIDNTEFLVIMGKFNSNKMIVEYTGKTVEWLRIFSPFVFNEDILSYLLGNAEEENFELRVFKNEVNSISKDRESNDVHILFHNGDEILISFAA